MFQSLRARITLISLLSGVVIATGLLIAGTQIISMLIADNLITHSRLAAEELVSQINRLKAMGLEFDDIIDFDEQTRSILAKNSKIAYAGVYDSNGKLLFKSSELKLSWSPEDLVFTDSERQETQFITDEYQIITHAITPTDVPGDGFVAVAVERSLLYNQTWKSVQYFVILAGGLIFISLTIHFVFLRRSVIRPLSRLVTAVKAINPATFDGVLKSTKTDKGEIGELAQAFANLLTQLAEARNEALAQANRAISAEKNLNKTIVDGSPLAIYTRDKEGRITGWNKACEQMFGWDEEEVIGKPFPAITDLSKSQSDKLREHALEDRKSVQVELQRRTKDGKLIYLMTSISPLYDEAGETNGYLTIAADITRRKAAEQKIEFMAHHDALTQLPNRTLLEERFRQAVELARQENTQVALLFIDLDHFKAINDSFGHSIGDAYLIEIARRLSASVRVADTICRQGGDEFLIVLNGVSHREDILPVLSKLKHRLQEPVLIEGHELSVSMSIGVAMYPLDGTSFDELLKKSDLAMYQAKQEGKNTYRFFNDRLTEEASGQHRLRTALKYAVEEQRLTLYYQPQINLATGSIVGAEALLRWEHPEKGMISPVDFIPIAEESGLIIPIGEWVIGEACRQAAAWKAKGLGALSISVNLSTVQFKNHELEETILRALNESGLEPERLELELTESLLIHDLALVQGTIQRLKEIGVRISIDDFGTGYSSLAYLKRLDIDRLKIDRSFIQDLAHDPEDHAIVQAIIQMANSLQLTTIAEGVEDLDTLDCLHRLQCDEAQGFYFAKPMAATEFSEFVGKSLHQHQSAKPAPFPGLAASTDRA